jgi:hypothetical protein
MMVSCHDKSMSPAERSKVFQARMSDEEIVMLAALAEEDGVSSSDTMRQLVRREFERRFGDKRPTMQTSLRVLLDTTAKELNRADINAQLVALARRRKDFDRKGRLSATVLAQERKAYEAVWNAKESGTKAAGDKALIALEELEVDYVNEL